MSTDHGANGARLTTVESCHCGQKWAKYGSDHCDYCGCEEYESYCDLVSPAVRVTITVSAGRRIGTGDNLPVSAWETLQADLEASVSQAGAVHFHGTGTGEYQDTTEESFTVVGTVDQARLPQIRVRLARLASIYQQDSIALTVGQTEFVVAK